MVSIEKKNLDNIEVFFLVSRGRSGSTLLQSILDAHPNICAPIESKFVLHLHSRYKNVVTWNEKTINQFIEDLYTNRKFRLFWNINQENLKNNFDTYTVNHYRDACKIVYLSYQSFFDKDKIKIIVDKNPLHSRFTDILLTIFPESKFIHLVRDPRAVVYSHIKSLMQKKTYNLAFEWRLLNAKIENTKDINPILFYSIKYENLTQNPQKEVESLFEFINLDYNPDLLNANTTIKKNYKSNKYLSLPHHKNISKPISSSKNEAWKTNLNHHQVNIINYICKNQLIKYGYSYNPINESLSTKILTKKSAWRSKLINRTLSVLFHLPFRLRVAIYNLVSLFMDKKYTQSDSK